MSVGYVGAGALTAASGTVTLSGVALPATRPVGGLGVLVFLNRFTISTPPSVNNGWVLRGSTVITTGGTEGTVDEGTIQVWVYTREWDGTELAPIVTHNQGTNDGTYGMIFSFSKTRLYWEPPVLSSGTDLTGDTTVAITAAADPGGVTDDMLVVAGGANGDVGGVITSGAVTWPGATLDAGSTIAGSTSSIGDDGMIFGYANTVTAGPSSGAPSLSGTLSGAPTANTRLAAQFIRLRDTNVGIHSAAAAQTITAAGTAAASSAKPVAAAQAITVTQTAAATTSPPPVTAAAAQTITVTQTAAAVAAATIVTAQAAQVISVAQVADTALVAAVYLFRTPTRQPEGHRLPAVPNNRTDFDDGPRGFPLMRHVNRGPGTPVCVLVTGGVVTETAAPNTDELAAADRHYLGGHDYVITRAEKDVLEGAGYTVLTV